MSGNRVGTEGDASEFDIRAGNIDLHTGNPLCFVHTYGQGCVFVHVPAVNIGNDRGLEIFQEG